MRVMIPERVEGPLEHRVMPLPGVTPYFVQNTHITLLRKRHFLSRIYEFKT